ncbi:unnamed protein product [Thelazia callipaeda]|uniref:Kazal-like domain-containing protein n=1 Tax=Thelazia callipaeda TaxID=103827 RepID=A0A0N5CTB1_THECL|nr:unnamed protein product [Thelazia callipaeda]
MQKLCNYEEMNIELICGSDGRTYNSYCEVKRSNCHGNPVKKKFSGPCPENLRCQLEREYQLRLALEQMNSSEIFVPECNSTDGSYASIQAFLSITFHYGKKQQSSQLITFIICHIIYFLKCISKRIESKFLQCHKSTGYCWCVTRLGRPLPSTSTRYGMPNCHILQKTKIGRRSQRKSNGDSINLNGMI